jgi:uncharacterized protein YndB with AHSA1/START domain
MDHYGQFVSAEVIRFQRLLPGTAQEVWEHLTSPQWLAGWLGPGEIEPRVGGAVSIRFYEVVGGSAAMRGEVTVWEPPHRLAYTWQEKGPRSEVSFELSSAGDGVLLVFEHRRMPADDATGFAHGWHSCFNALKVQLEGGDQDAQKDAWLGQGVDRARYNAMAAPFGLKPVAAD